MDDRGRLAFYPFVVVRIACRVCSRRSAYRLARLAAKYGPEISLAISPIDSPLIVCGAPMRDRRKAGRPAASTSQTVNRRWVRKPARESRLGARQLWRTRLLQKGDHRRGTRRTQVPYFGS